jgi:hypothetical protein
MLRSVLSVALLIPQELNILVSQNQEFLYSLLIRSAGHTLTELAKDPKFLGAAIGVTSVLHTGDKTCPQTQQRHGRRCLEFRPK